MKYDLEAVPVEQCAIFIAIQTGVVKCFIFKLANCVSDANGPLVNISDAAGAACRHQISAANPALIRSGDQMKKNIPRDDAIEILGHLKMAHV